MFSLYERNDGEVKSVNILYKKVLIKRMLTRIKNFEDLLFFEKGKRLHALRVFDSLKE